MKFIIILGINTAIFTHYRPVTSRSVRVGYQQILLATKDFPTHGVVQAKPSKSIIVGANLSDLQTH